MKPFLKWAGGKHQIINRVRDALPAGSRLIEPFLGSGAVFLNTDFPAYLLSDINQDLINLYLTLQAEGGDFIAYARPLFAADNNNGEKYYQLRNEFNSAAEVRRKSALFLYLNRHGYNGLCRYNANGGYNVPFGRYKKPYFPEREMLWFWQKSQAAEFACTDFVALMDKAIPGDVVYCDPPYVPLSGTSNFTSYTSGGFGRQEQTKLAEMAHKLAFERGVPVLISNHAHDFILQQYQSARVELFEVQRFISCNGARRNRVGEVLALFADVK